MSSCLSGGGRTYGFELELIKSQTSSSNQTTIQSTSSSSSTLSESSNSPLSISTRKPRTARKRPNEIYNEAAALLSTAYPNIFSRKHFTQNPGKFTKPRDSSFYNDQSDELLLPFRLIDDFGTPLLHCHHHSFIQEKPRFRFEQQINSPDTNSLSLCNDDNGDIDDDDEDDENLNGESSTILDDEIEEGIIDSIMGSLCVNESNSHTSCHQDMGINSSYGYPMPIGLGFGANFGLNWGLRKALKPVDDGDWWRFPAVDIDQISPKCNTTTNITSNTTNTNNVTNVVALKKKKKNNEKLVDENSNSNSISIVNSNANSELTKEKGIEANTNSGLLLKLNFDNVLTAWSDGGSPFSDDIQASELAGADLHARLAQIDLFSENGGIREASVMRYKEKRRTRLFSKKIRYQVRKANADTRPRMKGRFVRRSNSNASGAQI